MFVGSIVPPTIGLLLDQPLLFSPALEMYIPRCVGCVMEVSHRLKIRLGYSIHVSANLTLKAVELDS